MLQSSHRFFSAARRPLSLNRTLVPEFVDQEPVERYPLVDARKSELESETTAGKLDLLTFRPSGRNRASLSASCCERKRRKYLLLPPLGSPPALRLLACDATPKPNCRLLSLVADYDVFIVSTNLLVSVWLRRSLPARCHCSRQGQWPLERSCRKSNAVERIRPLSKHLCRQIQTQLPPDFLVPRKFCFKHNKNKNLAPLKMCFAPPPNKKAKTGVGNLFPITGPAPNYD